MVVIIPALNEAGTIGGLVKSLKEAGRDVIVVNDGSSDGTGLLAAMNGARVVDHTETRGIKASILDGFRLAMSDGLNRRFAVMDAGGSHDPNQLGRLENINADIVIGSRFCPGAEYIGNPKRARASRIAAAAMNFASHRKITDWTSGYRIYSRAAVGALMYRNYYATGHAFQIEALTLAIRVGLLTIGEAPITYRAGRSSLRWNSIEQAAFLWLEMAFS